MDALRFCGVASCLLLLGLNLSLLRTATDRGFRLVVLSVSLLTAYAALDLWYGA